MRDNNEMNASRIYRGGSRLHRMAAPIVSGCVAPLTTTLGPRYFDVMWLYEILATTFDTIASTISNRDNKNIEDDLSFDFFASQDVDLFDSSDGGPWIVG